MELAILGVLGLIVAIWYGMLKPVETLAHMADDEIQVLAAERKAENVTTLSKLEVSDKDVKAAQANLTRLNSIKL